MTLFRPANIYCISGLGADERVFRFLRLPDFNLRHINWEIPNPDENLAQYAGRLLDQIDTSEEVILLGVSFGGMIAQEIARQIPCVHVIIISSIKSVAEMTWPLTLVRLTQLYRLVPVSLLKWANLRTADYYFSVENKAESALLRAIIQDTEPWFMRWAIARIMNWQPTNAPVKNLLHIHGTHDRIFPARTIQNAKLIPEAGHLMIVNRAARISEIILGRLNNR